MTPTIPADLTSERAGPILADYYGRVCMEWHADDEPPRRVDGVVLSQHEAKDGPRVLWWCSDPFIGKDNRSPVFMRLNPARPEVRDHCARWLARHLGNWQPWEITRAVEGTHEMLTSICGQTGMVPPGRWEPHPPAAEMMARLVLHAGGRS